MNYVIWILLVGFVVAFSLKACDRYNECSSGTYEWHFGSDTYDCACRSSFDLHPPCTKRGKEAP